MRIRTQCRRLRRLALTATLIAAEKTAEFATGVYQHAESISVLTFAAVGVNAVASEIPFAMAVPLWIEAPLVIPVIATLTVAGLVRSAEWRRTRRTRNAVIA